MEETVLAKDKIFAAEDDASLVLMRSYVHQLGKDLGLSASLIEKSSIVVSELGKNQIEHARKGFVDIRPNPVGPGLEILAMDCGAGIANIKAVIEEPSIFGEKSLRAGIGGVLRMADEVHFDIRLREGSAIHARLFEAPPALRASVGIFGRPMNDLPPNGDDGGWRIADGTWSFALVDGLGHGPRARESSEILVEQLLNNGGRDPFDALEGSRRALTRKHVGGTAALVQFNIAEKEIAFGISGDVSAYVWNGNQMIHPLQKVPPLTFSIEKQRPPVSKRYRLLGRECWIVLHSDGVLEAADRILAEPLPGVHPVFLAEKVLETYSKGSDDALVVVAHLMWS